MTVAFRIEVDDGDLREKLGRFGESLDRQMSNALRDVQIRIANTAKQTRLFRDRTGALRASIRPGRVTGSFSRGSLKAEVLAGGGTVGYAAHVHEGTRAHVIEARTTRALRIPTGSGFVFRRRVRHPGTRPRKYLDEAGDKVAPIVPSIVEAFTTRAIREAGLA